MVGASFGLQTFTQTRYDLHSQKVTQVRGAPTPTRPSFPFVPLPPFALAFFFLPKAPPFSISLSLNLASLLIPPYTIDF